MVPSVWEVATDSSEGEFEAKPLLSEDDEGVMARWLTEGDGKEERLFPVRLFHAGLPRGYGHWIMNEGLERFASFVDSQLPGPSIEGVEEYVRFAIKLAADLYAVSGQHRYVAEPIHTAVLFPKAARLRVYRTTR
jgi:hypothetical protein